MGTSKLIEKLDDFFNLSSKKQQKKQDKLLGIIEKLEGKKADLEQQAIAASEQDETSEQYQELSQKLKVVSKLLKKAKKQNKALSADENESVNENENNNENK